MTTIGRRLGLTACALSLLTAGGAWDAEAQGLSDEHAADLAARHAPLLVFHPEEAFLPTNPLFPLEPQLQTGAEIPREALDSILGTPEERRDRYENLSLDDKARLSTVYYRVHPFSDRSETGRTVVIEYWFYYVWNRYSVRSSLFPRWFDGSHPNDLEHLHVVAELDEESSADTLSAPDSRVSAVYVSAHEGTVPANRQRADPGEPLPSHPRILVELGSHAGAGDRDGDGRFTPGVDGESGYKPLWGVRDRGYSWSRYNPDYMEPRPPEAPTLCPPAGSSDDPCVSAARRYRLQPVDVLDATFDGLDLSNDEYKRLFEVGVHPFKRLLGQSNGEAERLVRPPSSDDRSAATVDRYPGTERGLSLGITTLITDPGFFVGGRYAFLHGIKAIPDFLFQAEQVVTIFGDPYTSGAILASFPIDSITKAYGGFGVVAESSQLYVWQQDWIGGLEFRLGSSRIAVTGRSLGDLTRSALDVRLFYFF